MHARAQELRGVLPAVVTPFAHDGSLDEALFVRQVRFLADGGVAGFFVAGTTGEGAYVTSDERLRMVELVREHGGQDRLLCVALIASDTESVLREADAIAGHEPDFVSAVTPFYLSTSSADLAHHFTRIAESSPAPLILYNIPQNTHNPLPLDVTLELAAHPNIAGIKDSAGVFAAFQRGLLATGSDEFTWIQGDDLLDAPALLMGGRCIVTGLGNAWIDPYVRMYRAATEADAEEVIRQQQTINELARIIRDTGGAVVPAIKAAAEIQGRSSARMRIGSMELSADQKETVRAVLREMKITK